MLWARHVNLWKFWNTIFIPLVSIFCGTWHPCHLQGFLAKNQPILAEHPRMPQYASSPPERGTNSAQLNCFRKYWPILVYSIIFVWWDFKLFPLINNFYNALYTCMLYKCKKQSLTAIFIFTHSLSKQAKVEWKKIYM